MYYCSLKSTQLLHAFDSMRIEAERLLHFRNSKDGSNSGPRQTGEHENSFCQTEEVLYTYAFSRISLRPRYVSNMVYQR
jgi:hypothetical protein